MAPPWLHHDTHNERLSPYQSCSSLLAFLIKCDLQLKSTAANHTALLEPFLRSHALMSAQGNDILKRQVLEQSEAGEDQAY